MKRCVKFNNLNINSFVCDYVQINVKRSMRGVECRWCMLLLINMALKKINILEYAFGEGGGGH